LQVGYIPPRLKLKLTELVSAHSGIRHELRSVVHAEMDENVRLTETDYQPRLFSSSGGEKSLLRPGGKPAVLTDLQSVWDRENIDLKAVNRCLG